LLNGHAGICEWKSRGRRRYRCLGRVLSGGCLVPQWLSL